MRGTSLNPPGKKRGRMKPLDRFLQRWRYRVVAPYIPPKSVLLDIGGYDGSLFQYLDDRIAKGICVDPLCRSGSVGRFHFLQQSACPHIPLPDASVDVITLLAVLEHVDDKEAMAAETFRVLKEGGRLLLTVPHPVVDEILRIFTRFRLADGIAAEEHHHFHVRRVVPLFCSYGFVAVKKQKFQGGLNHFFYFKKPCSRPMTAAVPPDGQDLEEFLAFSESQ